MACRLFGTKPLFETMLVVINWTLEYELQWNFNKRNKTFYSPKCSWKYRLRNGGHFVQGQMSQGITMVTETMFSCNQLPGPKTSCKFRHRGSIKVSSNAKSCYFHSNGLSQNKFAEDFELLVKQFKEDGTSVSAALYHHIVYHSEHFVLCRARS